ncbi:MAG TPA: metallophosphoesterase [Bryobacteraceae bacterium]|nr:metallophosphoesterase [Bryobacteraceae bacterium]
MRKLLVLFLVGAATSGAADKIVGGPMVVNATARSATVVWLVQSDELTLHPPSGPARKSPSFRVEQTTLTGLQPNTRYEYDASGQEAGKGSFKTPPTGGEPFQFVVYGDNRTRHDVHRQVIDTLLKHGMPDFVVQTGDMVENGNDNSLWPIFFDIEKELLRHTVFFPSLGNHERNSHDFFEFFQASSPYYSFNWGNAHFIVLNSDIGNVGPTPRQRDAYWAEQTKWLEEDLQNSQSADYRFIAAHHPPFTAVTSRQGSNPHMTALVPMFEKYHVSVAFFGHDHNYQHYLKNGIHYLVAGGGGAPLYDVDKPPAEITQKVVKSENYLSVSVQGKKAHIEAIAIDGKKLDEMDIQAK